MRLVLAVAISALPFAGPALAGPCERGFSTADQRGALEDMAQASEVVPHDEHGAPYPQEWMRHGRIKMGNNPKRFTAVMPWSLIANAPDNRLPEARVELRQTQLYVLSARTGVWQQRVSSMDYFGRHFSKDVGKGKKFGPLAVRSDPDHAEITVDQRTVAHFWPQRSRRRIEPTDIAGVLVKVEARVNPDDFGKGARYVMDAAADYWLDGGAKWDKYRTNGDAGIGRMKLLTPQWRTFYMTTADAAGLRRCIAP